MLKGVAENRLVVFGLIGSTLHHGKELLSSLLDYDLVSTSLEADSSVRQPDSRIQVWDLYKDRVVAYMDKSRSLLFLHFPMSHVESIEEQMELLILSAVFSVCHIMIVLHQGTKFDISILHKIRTLQVLKNELMPLIHERYPLERTKLIVSLKKELLNARANMCPGYCQPHLLFLFQMDRSLPSDQDHLFNKLLKSIDQQVSQIFQKFEIPGKKDKDPVINTFPVKVLLLPRIATSLNEHLYQWVDALETPEQTNSTLYQSFQKFKTFIHQRRDRIRDMLESRTFDPFPAVYSVQEVFLSILEILEEYYCEWRNIKEERNVKTGSVLDKSGPVEAESNGLKSVLFRYFDSTKIAEAVSFKQNQTAFQLAMNMYKQLAPDLCVEKVHQNALTRARRVFDSLSCGSERLSYEHEFTTKCEKIWKENHHQCGKKSLTGRPCMKALTSEATDEHSSDKNSECEHDSGLLIMSADGTGTNLKERKDPFTMEEANVEFYARTFSEQFLEAQSTNTHRSSKGSLRHRTSDQSIPKHPADFYIDLEMKIEFLFEHPSLCFPRRHMTKVYGWCSLVSSHTIPVSHKLNQEGFISGKNTLHPLKLNLPMMGPMVTEMDESFPPLRGHGQKPPPPLLWPQIQHQIKNLNQARKQLKKHWTLDSTKLKTLMHPSPVKTLAHERPHLRDETHGYPQTRPNSSVDVWLGLEYEAIDGTRFIASSRDLGLESDVDILTALQSDDIPLYLPVPRQTQFSQLDEENGVKSKSLAQLQRIAVITPPAPSVYTMSPCINVTSKTVPFMKLDFCLTTPVVLPPSSFSILRLPFVYSFPAKWKPDAETDEEWYPLIQSSMDYPYNTVVQRKSIIYPN
eukprot:g1943.t1